MMIPPREKTVSKTSNKRIRLVVVSSLVVGGIAVLMLIHPRAIPALTQQAHAAYTIKTDSHLLGWASNTEIPLQSSSGGYYIYNVQTRKETALDTLPTDEVIRWLDKFTRVMNSERQSLYMPNNQPKNFSPALLPLADKVHVTDCVALPARDKRVWRIKFYNAPLIARLIHKVYSGYKPSAEPTVGLCVSGMDGKNIKVLGVEKSEPGGLDFFEPAGEDGQVKYSLIHDIDWTPDGRNISFIHKNTLFILPAE